MLLWIIWGILLKYVDFDLGGLGWIFRVCVFNRILGVVVDIGLRIKFK